MDAERQRVLQSIVVATTTPWPTAVEALDGPNIVLDPVPPIHFAAGFYYGSPKNSQENSYKK